MFSVSSSTKNRPSARCASDTSIVSRDVRIFKAKIVFLNQYNFIIHIVLPYVIKYFDITLESRNIGARLDVHC
jgi:hypothetical protein